MADLTDSAATFAGTLAGIAMFDGKCVHEVEPFEGERMSVVLVLCE